MLPPTLPVTRPPELFVRRVDPVFPSAIVADAPLRDPGDQPLLASLRSDRVEISDAARRLLAAYEQEQANRSPT
jgi:hypothetical protein